MRRLIAALLVAAVFLALPSVARAEGPEWQSLRADLVSILYLPENQDDAFRYLDLTREHYPELAQVLRVPVRQRMVIRLYPTWEAYVEANPFVAQVPGLVSHAQTHSREIALAVPVLERLGPQAEANNLRHEMAHLLLDQASGGRLPVGFHEALAQYLERPDQRLATEVVQLRQSHRRGRLLSWAELNESQAVYQLPQIAYPQTLSMAAYLADRYGMERLVDLVHAFQTFPGYRSALESVYGKPARTLEAEWEAYLPLWFAGRWRHHVLYHYDLSGAEEALERGAYADAVRLLEQAVGDLSQTERAEELAQAQQLLSQAREGARLEAMAQQGLDRLREGAYAPAARLLDQARQGFTRLGNHERRRALTALVETAGRGERAVGLLEAEVEPTIPQLEAEAATLLALGNQPAARALLARAQAIRQNAQGRALGVAGLGAAILLAHLSVDLVQRLRREEEAWIAR